MNQGDIVTIIRGQEYIVEARGGNDIRGIIHGTCPNNEHKGIIIKRITEPVRYQVNEPIYLVEYKQKSWGSNRIGTMRLGFKQSNLKLIKKAIPKGIWA